MKKITKLSDLNQTNGKSQKKNDNGKFVPTTLDQLLGKTDSKIEVYGTDNLEEYKTQLNTLNFAELRNHALALRKFTPNHDRDRLIKQLISEFVAYRTSYDKPENIDGNAKLSKKKLESALNIMSGVK